MAGGLEAIPVRDTGPAAQGWRLVWAEGVAVEIDDAVWDY